MALTKKEWICPICERTFSRKNQNHSCVLYSIEDHHLKNASPKIVQLFHHLLNHIQKNGTVKVESLKNIIALKRNSQFCSIQVQKNALKIIFRLYSSLSSTRFAATSQQQDQRYYYQLKLKSKEDIDKEFLNWMYVAYTEN